VKKTLITLLLACIGLEAQTQVPPPDAPIPADAATPAATTNQEEVLRQALHGALGGKTNAPAPVIPISPSSTVPPGAPPPVVRRQFPSGARTNFPAAPAPGLPAPDQTDGVPAPAAVAAPEEMIPQGMIDFRAADINQVLDVYSDLVKRTILRPTALPAPTITLKTQTALTKKEAIQALDAVLAINGISMINMGDKFVKAVPAASSGQVGAPWSNLTPTNMPDLGQYVTHVVQLKYSKPTELVAALQPFASPIPNPILPIDSSQIVVLRDYTENVKRMLEMIEKIDIAVPSEYISEVIPIKYALSSDIANALNSLSSGGGTTSVGKSTTSGPRTTGGSFGRGTGTGGVGGTGYPGTTPGTFGSPQGTTTPAAGQGSFTDRLRNIIQRASVSGEIQVLGQTKIIADERTNSLLIFASREDMKMIKDIVSKLDIVLAQVLIETVIIQVSLDNNLNLGVSAVEKQQHGIGDYFTGIGAINNNNVLNVRNFGTPNGIGTNNVGGLPGGFSYLATLGNDLDVTVTAFASDTRAKILQRPRIQTSHAVPASLFVGESRPYPVSSYYGGASFGGYASIQQLQIGVTLEVTPLINPDGLVVMDIHQKIDSFEGNVTIQGVGDVPVTSSKEASAKVAVRDHDTVILGGMIETDKNDNNSGVPFLKDVPLLGFFFRSSAKSETRNELIVLIRPTVLPTPEVAALAAKAEKDRMPGIKRTEREILEEQAQRNRRIEQSDK
jgi:general secretion pathway protein D